MKFIAQIILFVLLIVSLLGNCRIDCEGCPAKPPKGFAGIVSSLISFAIALALLWLAGAMSELLPR